MNAYSITDNLLLRADRLAAGGERKGHFRHITFDAGHRFWEENTEAPYALFPLRGVISLQASPSDRKRVEVAQVGWEGFAGVSLFVGMKATCNAAVAVTPGEAILMPPEVFQRYLQRRAFREAAGEYLGFILIMLQQISTCNRVHSIESACVCRILMMQDRTGAKSFGITQDEFAQQLGVRRASVSRGTSRLQKHGAIAYDRRGRLIIVDRGRLERFACSCYRTIKNEFDAFVKTRAGF